MKNIPEKYKKQLALNLASSLIDFISSFVNDSFLFSFSFNRLYNFLERFIPKENEAIILKKNRVNIPQNNFINEGGLSLLANLL